MQEFLDLLQQNIEYVIGIPAVSAALALVARWGVNKLTTIILPWIEKIMVSLMMQFFGADEATDVDKLPIVEDIKELKALNVMIAEMELLRLKKETINPLFTEVERLKFQQMFDALFTAYQDLISEETKEALEALNNA